MSVVARFEPGTGEWLEQRRRRLGGSEIAAVLGLSPYESRFSLWHRKQGLVPPVADTGPIEWGKRLEPAVRDKFRETHPEMAFDAPDAYIHPTHGWMVANPDDMATLDGTRLVVEYKTADSATSWEWGPSGKANAVPVHYLCQVRWYMAVTDVDEGRLGVLIGGNDYREYPITRDRADEHVMIDAGQAFIESLDSGARPAIDDHIATYRAIREMHPDIDDGDVDLPPGLAAEYLTAETVLRAADSDLSRIKSQVMDVMGSARYGIHGDIRICERRRAKQLSDGSFGSPWVQLTRAALTDIKQTLTHRKDQAA